MEKHSKHLLADIPVANTNQFALSDCKRAMIQDLVRLHAAAIDQIHDIENSKDASIEATMLVYQIKQESIPVLERAINQIDREMN